jgi:hypothetical protein
VGADLARGNGKILDLLDENGFEVVFRDLVPALLAGVFRAVR